MDRRAHHAFLIRHGLAQVRPIMGVWKNDCQPLVESALVESALVDWLQKFLRIFWVSGSRKFSEVFSVFLDEECLGSCDNNYTGVTAYKKMHDSINVCN